MSASPSQRPLGTDQDLALVSAWQNGFRGWYPGCGWYLDTRSHTARVVASLARRGMMREESDQGYGRYTLTDTGIEYVRAHYPHTYARHRRAGDPPTFDRP